MLPHGAPVDDLWKRLQVIYENGLGRGSRLISCGDGV